jgi:hypothetical protein
MSNCVHSRAHAPTLVYARLLDMLDTDREVWAARRAAEKINLGANSTKVKPRLDAIIWTSVSVSLAVNPPGSAPHEAGGQDRLHVVSVVPVSEVLETGRRPLGVRLRLRLGTGQATDGASNVTDIAIAITGFITESSMMFPGTMPLSSSSRSAFWP